MRDSLFGVETEYAAVRDASPEGAAACDFDRWILARARACLPHLEDMVNGGLFLANGGRFYIDRGHHPEWATPETTTPWDTVRYVLAGDAILQRIGGDGAGTPRARFFRTNVDYRNPSATWGCHESILTGARNRDLVANLLPFLASRVVYTGGGGFDPCSSGLRFTLSPRAAHLRHAVSSDSTENRGLFHAKLERVSGNGCRRLHILSADSLRSEAGMWLRTAATVLATALVDGGVEPGRGIALANPLAAFRTFAADDACQATAAMVDGSRRTAIDIQRHYLALAERHAGADFMPWWTSDACAKWGETLEKLEEGFLGLARRLDWAVKRVLYEDRARRRGFPWDALAAWSEVLRVLSARMRAAGLNEAESTLCAVFDPPASVRDGVRRTAAMAAARGLDWDRLPAFVALRSELFEIDLRWGEIGGPDTLFSRLDASGALDHRVPGVDSIEEAVEHPPARGRAQPRGDAVRELARAGRRYRCGWDGILDLNTGQSLDLSDPFATEARWIDVMRHPAACESTVPGWFG